MALEAGCHVMCEKPPAMTPEQARECAIPRANRARCCAYDFTIVLRSIRNSCVNR
ncbi:Gfo/Idh/MocA family oxidoreductase [Escherichia coli]